MPKPREFRRDALAESWGRRASFLPSRRDRGELRVVCLRHDNCTEAARWKRRTLRSSSANKAARITAELRAYVALHPHAADTLQGVARWWLSVELGLEAAPGEIEVALVELEREGHVERRKLPDGTTLYAARTP